MKTGSRHRYALESELCEALASAARALRWRVYAETGGWDLLLERGDDLQVGVQAKLRPTVKVLAQAVDVILRQRHGPEVIAVLVPFSDGDFGAVAHACSVVVLVPDWTSDIARESLRFIIEHAPRHSFESPCWSPEFETRGIVAGSPSPRSMTPWRASALKACALLEVRGYLTTRDLRDLRLAPQFWRERMKLDGKIGRLHRLIRKAGVALPSDWTPEDFEPYRQAAIEEAARQEKRRDALFEA